MPKPGTVNTLLKAPTQQPSGFNAQSAGMLALPKIGAGLVSSLGTARPVGQTATFNPQPALATPQMTNSIQTSGTTALGTQVPTQVQQATPQRNAIQTAPVSLSGTSATGHTTALPGQNATGNGLVSQTPNFQTTPATYPGLVNSLAATSQQGSPQLQGAIQNLNQTAQGNAPIGQSAADIAADYGKQIADVGGMGARFAAGQKTTGTSPVAEGNAAITAQSTSAQQQALAQGESAALQGTAQQLTAQGQTANAYNAAGGLAQQGQSLQQSGLQQAGALAQPQLGAYGQGYYDPLHPTGGAAGGQYGTGPAAAANVASIQSLTQQANDWSASRQAATNIGSQLTNFLSSNQVNPTDFNAVNRFLQSIGAQTSSPQYKQFYNLITDLANTYAPVLSTTGDATNYKTELAQSLLDGTASGQTIPQILQSLDAQAQAKIQGVIQTRDRLQTGGNVNPDAGYAPTGSISWDNI